jgi:hypothetical protein
MRVNYCLRFVAPPPLIFNITMLIEQRGKALPTWDIFFFTSLTFPQIPSASKTWVLRERTMEFYMATTGQLRPFVPEGLVCTSWHKNYVRLLFLWKSRHKPPYIVRMEKWNGKKSALQSKAKTLAEALARQVESWSDCGPDRLLTCERVEVAATEGNEEVSVCESVSSYTEASECSEWAAEPGWLLEQWFAGCDINHVIRLGLGIEAATPQLAKPWGVIADSGIGRPTNPLG